MIDKNPAAIFTRLTAILKLHCPRCLRGEVFAERWTMNRNCSVCDLEFEREDGYFLGAMYFSYGLAIATGMPTLIVLFLLDVHDLGMIGVLGLQLGLSAPWLFRYSRIMWLHLDQMVDPR